MGKLGKSIRKKLDDHIIFDNKVNLSLEEISLMHRLTKMARGRDLSISTQLGNFPVLPIYAETSHDIPSHYYVGNRNEAAAVAMFLGLALLTYSGYNLHKQHQEDQKNSEAISQKIDQKLLENYLGR